MPDDHAGLLIFLLVSVEAATGFVCAEVIRLNLPRRWVRTRAQWRLAWLTGLAVYAINLGAIQLERMGFHLQGPAEGISNLAAVWLYPLIAFPLWLCILHTRKVLMASHGRDPYA